MITQPTSNTTKNFVKILDTVWFNDEVSVSIDDDFFSDVDSSAVVEVHDEIVFQDDAVAIRDSFVEEIAEGAVGEASLSKRVNRTRMRGKFSAE